MPYIVFSHGLDNKPEQNFLYELWKRKLLQDNGPNLDSEAIGSELNYWADVLYESPDTNLAAYESAAGDIEGLAAPNLGAMAHKDDPRIRKLAEKLDVDPDTVAQYQPAPEEIAAVRAERVPVPAWLRKRIMGRFVRDAHHYFFNEEFSPRAGATWRVRDELRKRFVDCVKRGAGSRPLVVVCHSMGTIIAYDVLKNEPDCPEIDGLMTIGSPLGLDEVQDFLGSWTRADGFPSAKLKGPWVNVYDPLDVVCGADPRLANDYQRSGIPVIDDVRQDNWGTWRHSISKYLQGKPLRTKLAGLLSLDWE